MDELGRTEWFVIGVTGMALAAAAHAAAGAAHIARDVLRTPAGGNPGSEGEGSDFRPDSGPGGWILFGTLILASGAIYHFVSGVTTVVKEVVHVTAR
ncbi:hypothetical protein EDD98_2631 [Streptomyces sp. PanSC19]|uniref:hypothetical protein n=1 Tax=Streptomyces sp. PanSC19 TaxID=1520455 RepID=UPI000F47A299|nr:hypothetical protein [Streptomyces sp. PanSC19]ROQ33603.1 hypothetical protein EDD98_2631 [Streptomyces sp. PanSC19]